MSAFVTEQLTVLNLFSDRFVFEFPLYQRPYRWGEWQANALLEDLTDACQSGPSAGANGNAYFLGSIVLVRRQGTRRALVLDGRQRLTTIAILIAVLRDLEGEERDKAHLDTLLNDARSAVRNIEPGSRLRIEGADGEALQSLVFGLGNTSQSLAQDDAIEDGIPERIERIANVVALYRGVLTTLDQKKRARLRDFLLHRCELVAVSASNEEKGLRIFQVLNTRGLSLSDVDLVKPDLLMLLAPGDRDLAAEKFDAADLALGSRNLGTLLRSIFFILRREVAPEKRDRFSEAFIDCLRQTDAKKVLLEDFEAYAQLMVAMQNGELGFRDASKNPNQIVESLQRLGWDSEDWGPVVLEILRQSGDDVDRAYEYLLALERTCYYSFITINSERASRETRRKYFAKAVEALVAGRDPTASHEGLWIPRHLMQQMFDALNQPFHTFQQRAALLRRIEVALDPTDVHPLLSKAAVIHVMPPKLRNASDWKPQFNAKSHRDHVNLLGNLILADPGQAQLAPRSFKDKKRILLERRRRHHFRTARDLELIPLWSPKEIRDRTNRMAESLQRLWQLH
jgi:Protein of unknown function DUF262/Protein of unknown function (DUF1524)